MRRNPWKIVLAIVAALFAGGGITYVATDDGEGGKTRTVRVGVPLAPPAVAVDGADKDTQRDDAILLDVPAQEQLERLQTTSELEDSLREVDDTAATPARTAPLAAPSFPGCRTAFVRNYSSRGGVPIRVGVLHQTVSRERGQSSQNALTAMANSISSGVSWHFLVGRSNGLCTYTVPLSMKAWTQASANPFAIGIEVEAYGDEGQYVVGKGRAKLISIMRRLEKSHGIPLRRGVVSECRVVRSGWVEHKDLDQATSCAGGHADVNLRGTDALIRDAAKDPCEKRCRTVKDLRAKHGRTHARFRKLDCRRKQEPRHGYCAKLRARNGAVHERARARRISLKGTYR